MNAERPAPSLIPPENPSKIKIIGAIDYFRGYFPRELNGKSYVDVLRM